jgi:hypothetical protein
MLNSLIGIIASSGGVAVSNSYESISTVTLGSAASTITFSSIPSTYQHLQLRGVVQASTASALEDCTIRINSDTTSSNYYTHRLWGTGASAASQGFAGGGGYYLYQGVIPANSSTNIFGALVIDILDYANTNKNTTTRTLSGVDLNGSGQVALCSGLWLNTAAVNTVTVSIPAGTNFNQYSQFALYGIKG